MAYSVLTNIDDLVQMQRERSVTYENLPGFVAKYRIDRDLGMVLWMPMPGLWSISGTGQTGGMPCRNRT